MNQTEQAPRCDCSRTEVRALTQANTVVVAREQCVVCGRSVRIVPKSQVDVSRLPSFDESLQKAWNDRVSDFWQRRQEQFNRDREKADAEWWAWYDAYLRSPQWAAIRAKVLARDNYQCQGCRSARATQAHHLTYKRVGREMLFDLVAVCDRCHEVIHSDRD